MNAQIYLPILLMFASSVIWIAWFFVRTEKRKISDGAANIELGKQKQNELDDDLSAGLLSAENYPTAKAEIIETLANELEAENPAAKKMNESSAEKINRPIMQKINRPSAAFLVVIFFALTTAALFQLTGLSLKNQNIPPILNEIAMVENMLAENPENADLWRTLGFLYFQNENFDRALAAYENAYARAPDNVRILTEYASTLAAAENNQFSEPSIALIKTALEIDPNATDALYLAGLVAVSAGNFELAEIAWRRAFEILPDDHPDKMIMRGLLAELEQASEQKITDETMAEAMTVQVKISAKILNERMDDYLMIYAQNETGGPPLAIQKMRLGDFSGEIVLSDANAVIPTLKLSTAASVIVIARISKSGEASKQSGDIEVRSPPTTVGENAVIHLKIE